MLKLDDTTLVSFSVIKCLTVILTLFRLRLRMKLQRFWWEDTWAAVALICTVISVGTVIAASGTNDYERTLIADKIDAYMFICIVWFVRMSLMFSIIRITYPTLLRRIALAVAACFLLFWATTLGLQAWWCVDNTRALPGQAVHCVLPRSIIIFQVTINCIADMTSVIFPLKLLWRVKLPHRQRRMVLSLFTTSRFLCGFSLAHSIAQLVGNWSIEEILANLQLAVFMIVCNLLVVVTHVYRVFLKNSSDQEPPSMSDPSDDDDFTTPARTSGSTQKLTTVDLGSSLTNHGEFQRKREHVRWPPYWRLGDGTSMTLL
ncbi:hypothetical protein OG21DRAFT_1446606 [Imleria badia]|nr:hypothetical protein OG21DRAFT_1446606 [Imleria badia]